MGQDKLDQEDIYLQNTKEQHNQKGKVNSGKKLF